MRIFLPITILWSVGEYTDKQKMGAAVSVAFVENRQWYGYCQLHAVLPSEGSIISEKMVLRLMEKLNTVKVA
jgi:hypothetical protein